MKKVFTENCAVGNAAVEPAGGLIKIGSPAPESPFVVVVIVAPEGSTAVTS